MQCQILLSEKYKTSMLNLSFAEFAHRVVNVNNFLSHIRQYCTKRLSAFLKELLYQPAINLYYSLGKVSRH